MSGFIWLKFPGKHYSINVQCVEINYFISFAYKNNDSIKIKVKKILKNTQTKYVKKNS